MIFEDQFWVNANGNFLDICVLEWCKLFADKKGQHHWEKAISDQTAFSTGLIRAVNQTQGEFDEYIAKMKKYRDKFIAHLDEENVMDIPALSVAHSSVAFLYDYLLANEEEDNCFIDAPRTSSEVYYSFQAQGKEVYSRLGEH